MEKCVGIVFDNNTEIIPATLIGSQCEIVITFFCLEPTCASKIPHEMSQFCFYISPVSVYWKKPTVSKV